MASSPDLDEASAPEQTLFGKDFSMCDRRDATQRSLQVLERLALTLGVPVETFFVETARSLPPVEATDVELAELTQYFLAITDPVMRRYCLDVVRAAASDTPVVDRSRARA